VVCERSPVTHGLFNPCVFVGVHRLPLHSNGKVYRVRQIISAVCEDLLREKHKHVHTKQRVRQGQNRPCVPFSPISSEMLGSGCRCSTLTSLLLARAGPQRRRPQSLLPADESAARPCEQRNLRTFTIPSAIFGTSPRDRTPEPLHALTPPRSRHQPSHEPIESGIQVDGARATMRRVPRRPNRLLRGSLAGL
jgi:hypothetical protein